VKLVFPSARKRRSLAAATAAAFLCGLLVFGNTSTPASGRVASPTAPPNAPMVINLSVVSAERVATILRSIYPNARISVDTRANAVIVVANAYDEQGMRTIASGIDVKNPTATVTDTYQLKAVPPSTIADRLAGVFPNARFIAAPNHTLLIMASPADTTQIKSIIATIDTVAPTPTPRPRFPGEAVRVTQRNARDIARVVATQTQNVRVAVSANEIILSGPQEDVEHAKTLINQLDVPQAGAQYTQVYRLRFVDANSVADLLRNSFPNLPVQVNADLNAITITANITVQRRIADAIAQLDISPRANGADAQEGAGAASGVVVISLKAALPGLQGGPSTSATDIANTVTQSLQSSAPDLHIVVPPNSTQLVLTGSPYSIKLAKDLIAQLDVPQILVALDTEVLEVDEGVQKQLGLKFPTAALSTTFSELQPTTQNPLYSAPQLTGLQPLTRTPLSLGAELDFLISINKARVLENPRITTISGRTASLRAGETVNILTTTGGGTGTVATTQVQSFQTGVTLDITPVVNDGNYITVTLHPSVNSIAGSSGTVPNIQTRDTTTTVGLHDGETLVIGGLIEDDESRTVTKIPILGDLPLIGKAFRNTLLSKTRNELVVTVTPHIVRPGESGAIGTSTVGIPRPIGLPTLPPGTTLPPPRRSPAQLPSPAPEPEPQIVPTPNPGFTPKPGYATPSPIRSALAPSPLPTGNSVPTPLPLPSAFGQTNVYTFGSAPSNNFAAANQPPQIFFVQLQPSVVKDGQQITISAITTTNVSKLTLGTNSLLPMATLQSVGSGQWQSTFTFSAASFPNATNATLILTATTGLGAQVKLPVPISVVGNQVQL
jgi:general secretion pathway protein D